MLVGLEGDVVKTLQSIKKGIALLDERRAALQPAGSEGSDSGDGTLEPDVPGAGEETVEGASQPARL